MATYAVDVENLTYTFPGKTGPALKDVTIQIPWHTRTLMVGSNGAGKSTLLKLLSGKHLCLNGKILVNGLDPFSPLSMHEANADEANGDIQVSTYLGTEWCHMNIINRDIGVLELLESIGLSHFQERGDLLCDILEIDLEWRMHQLSDGQKRRVQLVMGLLKPWRVLLLDEVTVDLDVIARSRLLDFLKLETETRKCSVLYATHIFDGLAKWPDCIYHIKDGSLINKLDYKNDVKFTVSNDEYSDGDVSFKGDSKVSISKVNSLHPLALAWLKRDNNIEK